MAFSQNCLINVNFNVCKKTWQFWVLQRTFMLSRNTERFAKDTGAQTITIETLYDAKAHYGR